LLKIRIFFAINRRRSAKTRRAKTQTHLYKIAAKAAPLIIFLLAANSASVFLTTPQPPDLGLVKRRLKITPYGGGRPACAVISPFIVKFPVCRDCAVFQKASLAAQPAPPTQSKKPRFSATARAYFQNVLKARLQPV
jgi:hypothetical protein